MSTKLKNNISIILPCRNEELGIGHCIEKIRSVCPDAEILIVDNNSNDRSAHIARMCGARVVLEECIGYGAACRKGFSSAQGTLLVLADADNSYALTEIPALITELSDIDMVVGERILHQRDAMPFMHRFCGNPFFSLLLRTLFRVPITDTQSGFIAIKKDAFKKLGCTSTGMEFISELYIKASRAKLSISHYPTTYKRRLGVSKLRTITDGFRHLWLIGTLIFH